MSLENNEDLKNQENITIEISDNENNIETDTAGNISESLSDNEDNKDSDEQNRMNKASKVILYVISAIIIVLCLIVLGKNIFFKGTIKNNVSSSSITETPTTAPAKPAPKKIKDLYILGNMPEDYELSNQDISDTKVVSTYKNKTTEIVFTQSTIKEYEPEYDKADEKLVTSHFSRGDGQDYTAYQIDGKCYIVWTTDEYTFEIKTSMKKSESIPLIFNVQKAETDTSSAKSE